MDDIQIDMTLFYTIVGYTIFGIYILSLCGVMIYCLMQLHLLMVYWKKGKGVSSIDDTLPEILPFVTIQLPIFNEQYVVERLIDNIAKLNYPKDRFEIHILDDSTDQTVDISKRKVEEYQHQGYHIELITREKRQGYKAGALKDAMQYAKGELIAIFDADFLPDADFLIKTLPYFKDKEVGVVQTRWEHINESYSLLTRLQAFQLNVHFSIEQKGRFANEYLLQFNGTAGVWRRETIESAGGWEADTLTEDLDLSYRAQLKGWKIIYREDIGSPAELPAEMHGLKSQQFRWMKGGAETAKKMLPVIWRSNLPLSKRLHASIHLLSSSVFVGAFLIGLLSVPLLFVIHYLGIDSRIFQVFLISLAAIIIVYFAANVRQPWSHGSLPKQIVKFILIFPIFLSVSMGLSLHNAWAVLQGYLGKKSAFIRTPKFNVKNVEDKIYKKQYLSKKLSSVTWIEGILAIYFAGGLVAGIILEDNSFFMLHLLLTIGYGFIFFLSVKHLRLSSDG